MPRATISAPLLVATLASSVCTAAANETLTIGDAAPPLDIAHWMKGTEVTRFEPGHIYVLEFWATWCGPCIANMDHLSRVQERLADRAVHVIGVSDEPLQTTVSFLFLPAGDEGRLQNDRVRYALATDPDRSVHRDYFEAASQRGIPAVFIIGRDARVEWIGHPKDMDPVLEALLDDRWDRDGVRSAVLDAQERDAAIIAASERLRAAMADSRWADALESIDVLIAHGLPNYVPTKIGILLSRMRDYERGYAVARHEIDAAWDSNPLLLHQLAWYLSYQEDYPIEPEHRDLDLALRAAERAVELEPLDYHLETLARVHAARGERAAAAAAQSRAIQALEAQRDRIRPHELDRFEEALREMRARLEAYRTG